MAPARILKGHARIALTLGLLGLSICSTASAAAESKNGDPAPAEQVSWPVQLSMRVPFEPTAFPSGDRAYLMYELYLTNFGLDPVLLARVEVLDADTGPGLRVATFEGGQLNEMLQPIGAEMWMADGDEPYRIPAGGTVALFVSVAFPREAPIPTKLVHRVLLSNSSVEGAPIGTHHTKLHVLGRPVEGTDWFAADGPSNSRFNHHRRGIFIRHGSLRDSRRYAIDWKRVKNGAPFGDNQHDARSYYAYGQPVLAVADAIVVEARDGLPDNPPGHNTDFHPAIPVTIDTAGGNSITLDLGDGQFAHYYHLRSDSVRVKVGDHVRRGLTIAQIGASGDAREPHLHFEVTTSTELLAGEGVPYLIDRYKVSADNDHSAVREGELPLEDMAIDFGGPASM